MNEYSVTQRPILVVHSSPDLYGSDRVLLEDVRGILAAGWTVTVALPSEGPLSQALKQIGADVEITTTAVLRKSIFTPRGALAFSKDTIRGIRDSRALLRKLQPAAVLVNTTVIPLWIVIARLTGHNVLLHVHESERHAPALMRMALSLPGTFCNKIIANSRYTLDAYTQFAPWIRRQTQVVLNGIPGPTSTLAPRETLTGSTRLLYVGRLSERKGVLVAVQALDILLRRGFDVHLSLVGAVFPGYEWFEIKLNEEIAKISDPSRVSLLGFHNPVWPHYESCDIAVVPSEMDESFGNVAVEAILAERPAVVSRIGGLKEAVEDYPSAVLVLPGSPEQFADGIQNIVEHWSTFRVEASQSRRVAEHKHDPSHFGSKIAQIVSSVSK